MTPGDLFNKTIAPADKAAYLAALATAKAIANKYSSNVAAADKNHYQTIGAARAGMDEVFMRSMAANPGLVPGFVDMAKVAQDRQFRADAADLTGPTTAMNEGLLDSILLASNDSFLAYTAYYNSVKMAVHRNVPGADAELAKLAVYFPSSGSAAKKAKPS